MADTDRTHGRKMAIEVGATPIGFALATDWEDSSSCGKDDVTACGDLKKVFDLQLPEGGGRLKCWWNGDNAGQLALRAAHESGELIDLHIYPKGTKVAGTDKEWFGPVKIDSLQVGGGVNSAFAAEFTYINSLTYRTIPTP